MQLYIVAVLVAVLLVLILFFALRSTVKRIDYNTKKYFVDKLQDYDYLIEEKKQVLDKINKEIEKNKKRLNEMSSLKITKVNGDSNKYYGNNKVPKYEDGNLFEKYKDIKQKFAFDYEKIITKFIKEHSFKDEGTYEVLVNIKNKFNSDTIYKVMSMRINDQKKYIMDILDEKEQVEIKSILNLDKLKIKNFMVKLDNLITKKDPYIYIYTGEKNKDYNYIDNNVKTIYDSNINEGIKISYKGIVYDYSL